MQDTNYIMNLTLFLEQSRCNCFIISILISCVSLSLSLCVRVFVFVCLSDVSVCVRFFLKFQSDLLLFVSLFSSSISFSLSLPLLRIHIHIDAVWFTCSYSIGVRPHIHGTWHNLKLLFDISICCHTFAGKN